ncbi:MAG: hypothetical protein IPG39_21390 [Bacteroidetes bacterium]|nr:hypothetical protein [Bacteroidota bacterium]
MVTSDRIQPQVIFGLVIGAGAFLMNWFFANGSYTASIFVWLIPAIALLFIIELYRNKVHTFDNIAMTLTGLGIYNCSYPAVSTNGIPVQTG